MTKSSMPMPDDPKCSKTDSDVIRMVPEGYPFGHPTTIVTFVIIILYNCTNKNVKNPIKTKKNDSFLKLQKFQIGCSQFSLEKCEVLKTIGLRVCSGWLILP